MPLAATWPKDQMVLSQLVIKCNILGSQIYVASLLDFWRFIGLLFFKNKKIVFKKRRVFYDKIFYQIKSFIILAVGRRSV